MFRDLVDCIADVPSSPFVFNQYRDIDPLVDIPSAAAIRRQNLALYLEAIYRLEPESIWVLETPSKEGAVRTGVPFTGDRLLDARSARLSVSPGFSRATLPSAGMPAQSPTSRILWDVIGDSRPPLLWNCVMVRTHRGHIRENRNPEPRELVAHSEILRSVVNLFSGLPIVWVGQSASLASSILKLHGFAVRHPANDLKADFPKQIAEVRTIIAARAKR